jgi:ribonuclease-3
LKHNYKELYQALNYHFKQESYLTTALTHRSVGSVNNERLEFLGDALLGYIVAEALFERFPNATEGELTRSRASLVKGETLADIAHKLELGKYLRLGSGELKSGGWRRSSILSDALEALIGAIYLDADMETCRKTVIHLLNKRLKQVSPHALIKDPKTRLQEYLQAERKELPVYRVLSITGEPHAQHFSVECCVDGLAPTQGEGESRRRAEQIAAEKALNILKDE